MFKRKKELGNAKTILEGIHYDTGKPIQVTINSGIIDTVREKPSSAIESGRLPVIAPGLVDLQVNGYMGVDFNAPGLTVEQVQLVSLELLRTGVTGYYPTLITGPEERTMVTLKVISEATCTPGPARSMIDGIHMEGPFISNEDGPRGAHPEKYCMEPDPDLVERWNKVSGGMVRIITLAPELPGSENLIRACRKMGITVGIGHTQADSGMIHKAVLAGATLSTHLGNGSHGSLPRHPNYIWDQLAEEGLFASMIADGYHLPDAVLKVFIKVKRERAILVSDSMTYSGLPPGVYESPATGKVRLTEEGKLHMEGDPGTLAGSASKLIDGIRKISSLENFPYAWNMASLHPNRLMEVPAARGIVDGAPASLVLLSQDEPSLEIQSVICKGMVKDP